MIYKGFGIYFMVDNKLGLKGKKSLGYLKSGILLWFELIDYMKNLVRNWFVNVKLGRLCLQIGNSLPSNLCWHAWMHNQHKENINGKFIRKLPKNLDSRWEKKTQLFVCIQKYNCQ